SGGTGLSVASGSTTGSVTTGDGGGADASGSGVAGALEASPASSSASCPAATTASALVICGAAAIAAVVPPITSTHAASPANAPTRAAGAPASCLPSSANDPRKPSLRTGCSMKRYDSSAAVRVS